MRRVIVSVLFACIAAALPVVAEPPPNFGTVLENAIYRGGQPRDRNFDYLHELGVRTILKLNHSDQEEERAAANRLGMKLVELPFEADSIGSPETCGDVARSLAVLTDEANWPVYVHCSAGRDRTGYIVGVYRELIQNWTWAQVDRELARYGHAEKSRRVYPAISAELQAGASSCSDSLTRTASAAPSL